MKTTHIDLVKELSFRDEMKYKDLIERALNKGYHDFKFDEERYPDCICPKIDLANDLLKFPELSDLREAVINGEYDESPDDEDSAKILSWLLR